MTSEKKNMPGPKERLGKTLSKTVESRSPRTQNLKSEAWYQAAFERFSVSKAVRGDELNRLLPPRKFD